MPKQSATPYLFLAPCFLFFFLIAIYPLAVSLYLSFFKWSGFPTEPMVFVGLSNYIGAIYDDTFAYAFWNTLKWGLTSVLVAVTSSILLASAVNFKVWGHGFIKVAIFSTYILPTAAVALIWRLIVFFPGALLDTALGMLNIAPSRIGWLGDPNIVVYSMIAVAIWAGLGLQVLIFSSAMNGINPELYDSAKIDGASLIRSFIHITLPSITDAIVISITLCMIGGFTMFTYPYLLGGAGGGSMRANVNTLATLMFYTDFQLNNVGLGSAYAWFMMFLTVGLVYIYIRKQWRT